MLCYNITNNKQVLKIRERKEPVKINDVSRTRCSTSRQRVYARLRRATAKWCTAEPGPRLYAKKPGSWLCSAPLTRCAAPGTRA
ncbi:MAG: hypothetical protein OJF62_002532 [Pseudolabrys sp.]|nr:hypothetical protein [Pseudolabrys sp.]